MTLAELRIENLGVISELSLSLPTGSIAVTGETGAGKTMVVGAIQLLRGGRAEPDMVRRGAKEAVVEGLFVDPAGNEVVARRVIPVSGRSRAYLDGSIATAAALSDRIAPLVDLHGQHSQQSLLKPATQRAALDRFGSVDRSALRDARADVATIDAALADLGGDSTERAREIDLLRYQLEELTAAELSDPDEDVALAAEEERLANVFEHRQAASAGFDLLGGDGPAADAIGAALAAITPHSPFAEVSSRLSILQEELSAIATDVRAIGEDAVDDPDRRETIRRRRQLLVELQRKYGPTLVEAITYSADVGERLARLESHEQRVEALTARRVDAASAVACEAERVRKAREAAAEPLARAVEAELAKLAMPDAEVTVAVTGEAGEEVEIRLAPNAGLPALPVGKNASGGELSRTMLALRLVLSGGPPVKIFDEVDAGIGGSAARSVGAALAELGESAQVFVVTHLPQVAARADHQIVIDKTDERGVTSSHARLLSEEERVIELSRMLSGSPDSTSAQQHAEELLRST